MATDENKNNQNPVDPEQNPTGDATPGDILEQLKADAASVTNLYKLELKLYKTTTDIDKNLLKQQKIINQAKRNLDSMNNTLRSLDHNVTNIGTTVSSVDSTLHQILSILDKIRDVDFASITRGNSSGTSGASSQSAQEKLEDAQKKLDQLKAARDAGEITDDEFDQRAEPLNEDVNEFTREVQRAAQAARIMADAINDFSGFDTFEDKYNVDKQKLKNRYSSGNIDDAEFAKELKELSDKFKGMQDSLEQGQEAWKNQGSFSFADYWGKDEKDRINADFDEQAKLLTERFKNEVPDADGRTMSGEEYNAAMSSLANLRDTTLSDLDFKAKAGAEVDKLVEKFASGGTYDARTGQNTTASSAVETLGAIGGELVGSKVGTAIGTAIGGPVGAAVGSKIEALSSLIGDRLDYLANQSKKTRDEILKAGIDKLRSDVKDMATYSIEIYESASKEIYSAWDKNLGQVTATQGYTKEALNSLQDSVAQRLQKEGYGATINASEYLDQLSNTLNANLGGPLAEAFAAQNLILQKAVPEVDLSTSAAQFAAIYTNANKQGGNGEETMIAAMNEIAGAAKALEDVTDGNNQFLKETNNLLSKATEVVSIAGGNADQIADLTTQMMASEAAITSLSPQLNGFTSELVSILMNNNDATAVSLRAIMNDIDSNIGVSATSFMQSFMEDTQGTLSTAFAAIQRFIDQNENEASRQEFLQAMESVFGVSGSKLAQVDFASVSNLIAQTNTSTNMAALTSAENMVRSGETTTAEEQLVANTANQLLATNAISSTLDNKLMRKLENNELAMEKMVYSLQSTQSVDLAENTLGFFTKISDLIMSIIDPFGLFDMLSTSINAATSAAIDAERYLVTSTMSSIGSTVADSTAGMANTLANTIGGATAVMAAAETKSTDAMVAAVEISGVSPTFEHMMIDYSAANRDAQAAIAANTAESNVVSYAAMEQQARQSSEYQQKQDAAKEQDAKYEEDKAAAREQQRAAQEAEDIRNLENHDNIVIIKDALDNLDVSEYLSPILDEHRTHTEQIKDLQEQTVEIVRLLSTIIEYSMTTNPEFASTISFDERSRIMDNGYIDTPIGFPFF